MDRADIPRVAVDNPIPASWDAHTIAAEQRRAAAASEPQAPATDPAEPYADVAEFIDAEIVPHKRRDGSVRMTCASCGAEMREGTTPHRAVARVVRRSNRFGGRTAGEVVYVELQDLAMATEATMSLNEYRDAMRAAHAPRPVQKPMLREMVERSMEATIAQTRRLIEDGKLRAEMDQQRAAAEAAALRRAPTAVDAEPASQPTAPVAMGA